jgi:hypothetical protein
MLPLMLGTVAQQLLFSVAIYRNDDVVQNILMMSVNGTVVFHLNALSNMRAPATSDRVVANPERLSMRSSHVPSPNSLLEIFQSNLRAAWPRSWTHVVHMTENERIVRPGIDRYVLSAPYGGFSAILSPSSCTSTFVNHRCRPHNEGSQLYRHLWPTLSILRYGQVDGAFFPRRTVESLLQMRTNYSGYRVCCPQEKVLPSLFNNSLVAPSITFMNWRGAWSKWKPKCEDLAAVRAGAYSGVYAVKRADDTLLKSCSTPPQGS